MAILQSLILFVAAAFAEIGGAWLVWQGVREQRGIVFVGLGIMSLAAYGFVATFQPDANFGRILAAYGGIVVAGSLAWGVVRRRLPSGSLGPHRRGDLLGWGRGADVRPATGRSLHLESQDQTGQSQ